MPKGCPEICATNLRMLEPNTTHAGQRVAYTLAEFAELFGKNRSWSYRMAGKNQIKTIKGYGCALVPASEVDRLVAEAGKGGAH